jgi:hypothetical protein
VSSRCANSRDVGELLVRRAVKPDPGDPATIAARPGHLREILRSEDPLAVAVDGTTDDHARMRTCSCSRPTSTPFTSAGAPPAQRAVGRATPAVAARAAFAGGSMGPKVEAVCRFVEATGGRAAIGQLEAIPQLIAGTAGTQVDDRSPDVEFRP